MKAARFTLSALACALAFGTLTLHAQDERPIYPASSDKVSYAELDKLPDWRGIWQPNIGRITGDEPMLIGEYKARWDAEQVKLKAGNYEVPETLDNCEPDGMPTMMTMPYSLEFLFTPGKIVVNQEALMMVRRIFTDGRPLPAMDEVDPNYFGYSVGHWEGDTLVVETTNFAHGIHTGLTSGGVPGAGAPQPTSDNMKITERFTRTSDTSIAYEMVVEDPEVLTTGSFRIQYPMLLDNEYKMYEYACHEGNTAVRYYIETSRFERAQAAGK